MPPDRGDSILHYVLLRWRSLTPRCLAPQVTGQLSFEASAQICARPAVFVETIPSLHGAPRRRTRHFVSEPAHCHKSLSQQMLTESRLKDSHLMRSESVHARPRGVFGGQFERSTLQVRSVMLWRGTFCFVPSPWQYAAANAKRLDYSPQSCPPHLSRCVEWSGTGWDGRSSLEGMWCCVRTGR